MKMFTYSIFDQATGAYMRPFFARSDEEALREFSNLTRGTENKIADYPQDFILHRVGTWDDKDGILAGNGAEKVITALEVIAMDKRIQQGQQELPHIGGTD